jgi:hypothetical protein
MFLFQLENWYLNSEVLNLNFKKLFDLKVEIWIPNYYFGLSKLIFQFRKLLIESLILNIIIWISKLTFQFWNLLFNFKKIIWFGFKGFFY